jgi:hypothetical protein
MAKDGPAAASTKRRKTLEPPPVDRLVMPAIVIGLAMLAYQFIKGITSEVSKCCCGSSTFPSPTLDRKGKAVSSKLDRTILQRTRSAYFLLFKYLTF